MVFVPGTGSGYRYIFTLNPKGLLNPEVWVYAFGQCFFSLSVAGSGSVIYGAYLGKDVKIRQSAVLCAVFDTSAALLAMLIIIPAMATVGADLGNGGPGLMFIYLLPGWGPGSPASSAFSSIWSFSLPACPPSSTCLKRRWRSFRKNCASSGFPPRRSSICSACWWR